MTDDSGDEGPISQAERTLTQGALKTLATKLEDLSTCNELIGKHGAALQRSLGEYEEFHTTAEGASDKLKAVNERAALFRITCNAMVNVSAETLLSLALLGYQCPCPQLTVARRNSALRTLMRLVLCPQSAGMQGFMLATDPGRLSAVSAVTRFMLTVRQQGHAVVCSCCYVEMWLVNKRLQRIIL